MSCKSDLGPGEGGMGVMCASWWGGRLWEGGHVLGISRVTREGAIQSHPN